MNNLKVELTKEQFTRHENETGKYEYVNERPNDYLIYRQVDSGISSGWVSDCFRLKVFTDTAKASWRSVPITILEAAKALNAIHTGTKDLPVIQFYSDEWVWFKNGSWSEMTIEEQIEWSKK